MSENGTIVKVRELILNGTLQPGERVTEIGLAERLKVSRTPIRVALPALAKEGLLEVVGRRGYAVRAFTLRQSLEALDIRALIEGRAAGQLAIEGLTEDLLASLRDCLDKGDAIFAKGHLNAKDEEAYGNMNERFHTLIVTAAGSSLLGELYNRVQQFPFVGAGAIAFNRLGLDKAFGVLFYAHQQHHAIVDAMASGDSARAEFLFREHANPQRTILRPPVPSS